MKVEGLMGGYMTSDIQDGDEDNRQSDDKTVSTYII